VPILLADKCANKANWGIWLEMAVKSFFNRTPARSGCARFIERIERQDTSASFSAKSLVASFDTQDIR
jgi:hypothetical protein